MLNPPSGGLKESLLDLETLSLKNATPAAQQNITITHHNLSV